LEDIQMNELNGKTILITGATNGIGKVAVLELARQGPTVVLVGRNPAKVTDTVQEIRQKSHNPQVDGLRVSFARSTHGCTCWSTMPGVSSPAANSLQTAMN
jgi:NAD(P)-dependent dehydrogenase (short-subunit alcohol dehydrogenase family)